MGLLYLFTVTKKKTYVCRFLLWFFIDTFNRTVCWRAGVGCQGMEKNGVSY
jgi:hypothetical protein